MSTDKPAPNTARWWIDQSIDSKRALIRSRLDDIKRTEKSIAECEADITVLERERAILEAGLQEP